MPITDDYRRHEKTILDQKGYTLHQVAQSKHVVERAFINANLIPLGQLYGLSIHDMSSRYGERVGYIRDVLDKIYAEKSGGAR